MKHYLVMIILIFGFLSTACVPLNKAQTDTQGVNDVKSVFTKYTEAIAKGNKQEALKYISKSTIDYYDNLIKNALYANEDELKKINVLSRLATLRIRHNTPVTYLEKTNGQTLLMQTWSSKPNDEGKNIMECVDCKIKNMQAICSLNLDKKPIDMKAFFYKENNQWKIDLSDTILSSGIEEIKSMIKQYNMSETDYILYSLKKMDKIDINKETLYKPLKKK